MEEVKSCEWFGLNVEGIHLKGLWQKKRNVGMKSSCYFKKDSHLEFGSGWVLFRETFVGTLAIHRIPFWNSLPVQEKYGNKSSERAGSQNL